MGQQSAFSPGGAVPDEIVQSFVSTIILQAIADLKSLQFGADAQRFFEGPAFERYCEILGWNCRRARINLKSHLPELLSESAGQPGSIPVHFKTMSVRNSASRR